VLAFFSVDIAHSELTAALEQADEDALSLLQTSSRFMDRKDEGEGDVETGTEQVVVFSHDAKKMHEAHQELIESNKQSEDSHKKVQKSNATEAVKKKSKSKGKKGKAVKKISKTKKSKKAAKAKTSKGKKSKKAAKTSKGKKTKKAALVSKKKGKKATKKSNSRKSKKASKHSKKKVHTDIGKTAELNKEGYEQVAAAKDNDAMTDYVARTMESLNLIIRGQKGKPGFKGMIPYYSGEKGSRTFGALKTELLRVARLPGGWCTQRGNSAPLSKTGFEKILDLKDDDELAIFAKRVAEDIVDAKVADEDRFHKFMQYYNGVKGKKGFEMLQEDMKFAFDTKKGWLVPIHEKLEHHGEDCWDACHGQIGHCDWCGSGNSCCPQKERPNGKEACKDVRFVRRDELDDDAYLCATPISPATVPLTEDGYQAIAQLNNHTKMTRFIRRVISKMDMSVTNDHGLEVMTEFYSGEKETRSFAKLQQELTGISHAPDNWITARGGSAALDDGGYQIVAKLGGSEMYKFIERALEKLGWQITKGGQGWANGLASFYSAEKSRSDWDTLEKELIHTKNAPVGRLAPLKKQQAK